MMVAVAQPVAERLNDVELLFAVGVAFKLVWGGLCGVLAAVFGMRTVYKAPLERRASIYQADMIGHALAVLLVLWFATWVGSLDGILIVSGMGLVTMPLTVWLYHILQQSEAGAP